MFLDGVLEGFVLFLVLDRLGRRSFQVLVQTRNLFLFPGVVLVQKQKVSMIKTLFEMCYFSSYLVHPISEGCGLFLKSLKLVSDPGQFLFCDLGLLKRSLHQKGHFGELEGKTNC